VIRTKPASIRPGRARRDAKMALRDACRSRRFEAVVQKLRTTSCMRAIRVHRWCLELVFGVCYPASCMCIKASLAVEKFQEQRRGHGISAGVSG
jgi:hypothetical protein